MAEETLLYEGSFLSLPEDVSLQDGLVIRARGVTVDHKPGSLDRDEYPIGRDHLDAEYIDRNDHLDYFEVSLKPYGEEPRTYDVEVVATDGAGFEELNALERQADALEEIAEQQRIQNSVLFELVRTLDHRLPELRDQRPEEPSDPRSGRNLATWIDDASHDLEERFSEGSQ